MVQIIQNNQSMQEVIEKCDDVADTVIRRCRKYLPHAARLCLIATFLEDGFRLVTQFSEQMEYIASLWNCSQYVSAIFIVINIFTQFGGSGLVLVRKRVNIGCALLMATVILQTIGYQILTRMFLMRNLSLCGSLLLLLAETMNESKSLLAGLPSTGENAQRTYLLLGGRILSVLMFASITHFSGSFLHILQDIAALVLIVLVAVGLKTKLCAVILVVWLSCMNLYYNNFWTMHREPSLWDFVKYDFFQTWSVIGGLILIVAYGPGGVSVDDYKKKW